MSRISISENNSYQLDEICVCVKKHFENFNMHEKIKPDMKVLIKPNLLMKRTPEEFTTAHPTIVEATIIYLESLGVKNIVIADSPGGVFTEPALKGIYKTTGMEEVCLRHDAKLNFDVTSKEIKNDDNKLVKNFTLISAVVDADFIIDIAKLKSHSMTLLSGCVKNLFGCVAGLTKPEFHWRFPEKEYFCDMLVDLAQTVSPDFAIVDAIESMEGDGPSGGSLKQTNRIFASDNIYDLDMCLCKFIGAYPLDVYTVRASVDRGLCSGNVDSVEIVGEKLASLESFILPNIKKLDFMEHVPALFQRPAKYITRKFFTSKPYIRTKECIGCGKCAESCPAKIITIKNKKASINYKNCISCFCCHEMCPIKVIDIKRSAMFKTKESK